MRGRGDPARAKRGTLITCILGSSIVFIDATAVNLALPAIAGDLGGGLTTQQWVVNGYTLTLAALILLGGSLGDVFGERRVFAWGLAGFGMASLACGLAPSADALIAARALQGAAGALVTPAALALIIATFDDGERGAAIGRWTAWSGIASIAGPLVGGQLVDLANWRWIFLVNLPLVLVTLALVVRVVPERRGSAHRPIDVAGALLATLGLAGPVFALIEQPRLGWSAPAVLAPMIIGAVLLAAFVLRERTAAHPMLPLELFARRNFAVGNLQTLLIYAGLSIKFFVLTLFLQQVAGWTAAEVGLATLPTTLLLFALSARFGALADRLGPRVLMGFGPLMSAAGLLLLLRVDRDVDVLGALLPALLLFALGLAMTVAPLTATVLAGVPEEQAGIASAVNNAVARVAGLAAVAALAPLLAGQLDLATFHLAVGVAAVLVAGAGLLGGLLIQNPARAVSAEFCPGGPLVGAPRDVAGYSDRPTGTPRPADEPAAALRVTPLLGRAHEG